MSANNTEDAVILGGSTNSTTDAGQEKGDVQGRPEIGKDYYINRGYDECASSLSSLSGGFTNMSKLRFGSLHYDAENGGGHTRENARGDGFEVDIPVAFDRNNTEDRSSLSSLTNDYARKGASRFGVLTGAFAKRKHKDLPYAYGMNDDNDETPTNPTDQGRESNGSPWYDYSNRVTIQHANQAVPVDASSPSNSNNSSSPEVTVNTPEKALITPKQHLDELVQAPRPSTPRAFLSASRRVSDLDTSRHSQLSNSRRSEGFATYVANGYNTASRRKKMSVMVAIVLFVICVIAITVAALNIKSGTGASAEESPNQMHVDAPYDKEETVSVGDSDASLDKEGSLTSNILPSDALPSQVGPEGQGSNTESLEQSTEELNDKEVLSHDEPDQSANLDDTDVPPDDVNSSASDASSTHVTEESNQEGSNGATEAETEVAEQVQVSDSEESSPASAQEQGSNNEAEASTTISSQEPSSIFDEQSQDQAESNTPSEQDQEQVSTGASESAASEVSSTIEEVQISEAPEEPFTSEATPTTTTQAQITTASIAPEPSSTTTSTSTTTATTTEPTTTATTTTTAEPTTTTTTTKLMTSSTFATPNVIAPTIEMTPNLVYLNAAADTSIFKNRPDNIYGGREYLAVKGIDKATCFIRFDGAKAQRFIPTYQKYVAKATLRVFTIVTNQDNAASEAGGIGDVSVDILQKAGMWDESLISYANPILQSRQSLKVGSFSVAEYPYTTGANTNGLQGLHEIDVTDAFRDSYSTDGFDTLTFKLYSEVDSTGRVDFASKEWNGGLNQPELIIKLSDTPPPTPNPTTRPPTTSTSSTTATVTIPVTTSVIVPVISTTSTAANAAQSICELKCEEKRVKDFEKEFGFETLQEYVDWCQIVTPDCEGNPRNCKKECEKDAQKADDKAREKIDKKILQCQQTKCVDAVSVELERSVDVEIVAAKAHKPGE